MSEKNLKIVPGNFVICDVQKEYAECLFRILTERLSDRYQFHLFTDADRMVEFTEQAGAAILLVSEEYLDYARHARAEQRFVLTELPCVRESGQAEFISLFRYQPAERILKEICGNIVTAPAEGVRMQSAQPALKRADPPVLYRVPDPQVRPVKPAPSDRTEVRGLIGVYSPVHRIGKTKFALRLGQRLAEEVPVLYLSMEGYSGRDLYFPGNEGEDLGDLLYCMRQERSDHGLKISSMTGQLGRMDYIRPIENVIDLLDVKKEEWFRLFGMIAEKCVYEAVILDLGDGIDGLYEILERCSQVYTPYISEPAALAKLKQYEDNLREAGHGAIIRHTVKKLMRRKSRTLERDGG